jgi:predicted Fe-S protein YdhL (DUF1289 family)
MNKISNNAQEIQSPCVDNCCLDEKDVCLGCFRSIDEITGWHDATDQQKLKILNNCDVRRNQQIKI